MESKHKITTLEGTVVGVHDIIGRFAASYDNGIFSLYQKQKQGDKYELVTSR